MNMYYKRAAELFNESSMGFQFEKLCNYEDPIIGFIKFEPTHYHEKDFLEMLNSIELRKAKKLMAFFEAMTWKERYGVHFNEFEFPKTFNVNWRIRNNYKLVSNGENSKKTLNIVYTKNTGWAIKSTSTKKI